MFTLDPTVCELTAVVSPPTPEPELAPPAASTVPTPAVVELFPFWPSAAALPVVDVAEPVLLTVLVFVSVCVALELPLESAPPVVLDPVPPFWMVVLELTPVAPALPLEALAELFTELCTDWLLTAEVLPLGLEPLAPPPAALTAPVFTLVLLLPDWPVAEEAPLDELAVPVLETVLVFVVPDVELLLPPLVAPPVVVLPLEVEEIEVLVDAPVDDTLPLELLPDELVDVFALDVLEDVVAANAGELTSSAITPAAALARRGSSACFLTPLSLVECGCAPVLGFFTRATLSSPT